MAKMTRSPLDNAYKYTVVFIGLVFLVLVLKEFSTFLRPLALAIFITLLLNPIFRYMEGKKIPRPLTLIGLVSIIILIVFFMGSLIANESVKFESKFPEYIDTFSKSTSVISEKTGINVDNINFKNLINGESITKFISVFVQGITALITEIIIAVIFAIFLIPYHRKLLKQIEKNIVKVRKFKDAVVQIEKSIIDYIYAKTLVSLGTAVISGIILLFFDNDFVMLLSVLIFILNFIPNIGSFIAVGIALLTHLLEFGLGIQLFWLFVLLTMVQLVFGNIIEPKVAGDKLQLSPLVIILSLFIWYYIWGIGGMILAIPIMSIIKIILKYNKSTKVFADYLS